MNLSNKRDGVSFTDDHKRPSLEMDLKVYDSKNTDLFCMKDRTNHWKDDANDEVLSYQTVHDWFEE